MEIEESTSLQGINGLSYKYELDRLEFDYQVYSSFDEELQKVVSSQQVHIVHFLEPS